jgi:hypothetical protein
MGGVIGNITTILLNFAESGDYIQAIIQIIMLAVDELLTVIGEPLMAIGNTLMSFIKLVVKNIGSLLLPILEALNPIIQIFAVMFETLLVPLFNILAPFIAYTAGVLQLVLIPMLKAVAIAFEILRSPVRFIGDLFMWAAKQIQIAVHNLVEIFNNPILTHKQRLQSHYGFSSDAFTGLGGRIEAIWNMATNSTVSDDTSTKTGGGKSASYTGQRDITINFAFNNSYVNGDAQNIAISLHKEIKNAQMLGYI